MAIKIYKLPAQKKPVPDSNWLKLDNAAKIYPAAMSRKWTAIFRLSCELTEEVDPRILSAALSNVRPRFPSFFQKLKKGFFWYYLERINDIPDIQKDVANPCVHMDLRENKGFMFRVRYHNKRIAVEFFHVLTDGTGGMRFLKTLVAEYLWLKYNAQIPRDEEILDCRESPSAEELEDSFLKHSGLVGYTKAESTAYHIPGTLEDEEYLHIITGMMPVSAIREKAHELGVTITEFLCAVMLLSIHDIQKLEESDQRRFKPVKISIPVNLRKFYPTKTLRNFSSYVNPGIDPKFGDYSLHEAAQLIHHFMGIEASEKVLNAKFSDNVNKEKIRILRAAPLFIKNPIMRLAFRKGGDRTTSSTFSNLGNVILPPEMEKYVTRFDFILGPLSFTKVKCAAVSYCGTLYLNFSRKIKETAYERNFFTRLVRMGVHVLVESNQPH
ncbi:MAG: hypothetical protein J6D00_05225 [Christensenellaceae bacterium]|nr:hypothetical protein [Christensenellaceae bacterium]